MGELSCYQEISGDGTSPPRLASIWKIKVPLQVVAFGWLTVIGCILSKDNHRTIGSSSQILAPCLAEAESIVHPLNNKGISTLWRPFHGNFLYICNGVLWPLVFLTSAVSNQGLKSVQTNKGSTLMLLSGLVGCRSANKQELETLRFRPPRNLLVQLSLCNGGRQFDLSY